MTQRVMRWVVFSMLIGIYGFWNHWMVNASVVKDRNQLTKKDIRIANVVRGVSPVKVSLEAARIANQSVHHRGKIQSLPQANTTQMVDPKVILRRPIWPPRKGVHRLNPRSFKTQTERNVLAIVLFALRKDWDRTMENRLIAWEKKFSGKAFFAHVVVKGDFQWLDCAPFTYRETPMVVAVRASRWQGEIEITENDITIERFIHGQIDMVLGPIVHEVRHTTTLKRMFEQHGATAMVFHNAGATGIKAPSKKDFFSNAFRVIAVTHRDKLLVPAVYVEIFTEELFHQVTHNVKTRGKISFNSTMFFVRYPAEEEWLIIPFQPDFSDPVTLERFLFLNAIPAIWPVDRDNSVYFSYGAPVLALFTSASGIFDVAGLRIMESMKDRFERRLQYVLADLKDTRFVEALPDKDRRRLQSGFALIRNRRGAANISRYVYGGERSEDGLAEWIGLFFDGALDKTSRASSTQIAPPVSGQGVVSETSSLVRELTEHDWSAHVLDGTKDVLVVQYADTCVACKKFNVMLEDVAASLSHVDSLDITRINLQRENVPSPFRATSIPYVLLFPANRKNKPISIRMNAAKRHSLIRFLKRNAAIPFRARNRDVEVFYARVITFSFFWIFVTGLFLRRTKRASLFFQRVETKLSHLNKVI